ncbi:MAG: MASE3 domain-containing protein [Dehalococcoidia bacterium]|nr:MASE3 domain-containing protein [Dehalococcoidia bacterium]MDD5494032.1 MASE3 domain-containing protein [Dehalococcoidia bacterium]
MAYNRILTNLAPLILGLVLLIAIYMTSLYSYILFHSLVEIFGVVICFIVFIIAWSSRYLSDNNYFTFLGISLFFTGLLLLLHTLACTGLQVFPGYDANLAAQLWIAAKYVQSISFLLAPVFVGRRLRFNLTLTVYSVIALLLVLSIFVWQIFPVCYVEGQGPSLFKITSEFVICSIFIIAGAFLWTKRLSFDSRVLQLILISIVFAVLTEATYMMYFDPNGIFNMLSHFMQIVSFYLIYRAIVFTGLVKPYDILFRNLTHSRDMLQKERDRAQNFLDIAESILMAMDADQKITLINRKGCEILELHEEEIVGKSWFDSFVPGRIRQKMKQGFTHLMAGQVELSKYFERPVVTSKGDERIIAWHNTLLKDEKGRITGTFSSGQDITERKQAEDLFKAIFNRSPVGIYIIQDGKFKLTNTQFNRLTEYSEQELRGMDPLSLVMADDRQKVKDSAVQILRRGGDSFLPYDYRVVTKSGKVKWFMESVISITFEGKRATLGTLIDIAERKQTEELFKSLSLIDDLTGLYNRRGFLALAEQQLKLSFRMNKSITLMFADLDNMKWINDTLGHLEGDSALVAVARILKETFRETDVLARIGGDEFAVLMVGADETNSDILVSRLHEKLREFNTTGTHNYELSLSIGLAYNSPGTHCYLNDLLERADKLMYEKKRSRRDNRI